MGRDQGIIGSSRELGELQRTIRLCAQSSASVLILGESGTGKELVAKSLHRKSERAKAAFVPVNCAAIPRDLLESELFGYRKGAFSGAIADRVGRFELAHGGTLFLDEIGEMSLDMQAKLLRVLQEGEVDPVGANRPVSIDVRVVAATHRNLEAECEAGRFREDLYYRLNVLPIAVPPLRERQGDIPELLEYFARLHAEDGHAPVRFAPSFVRLLQDYAWPGNVRELANFVQRMAVLLHGQLLHERDVPAQLLPRRMREMLAERGVEPACREPGSGAAGGSAELPARPMRPAGAGEPELPAVNDVDQIILIANGAHDFPEEGIFLKEKLADFERKIIRHALTRAGGNITRTADLLKLQRTTLIQKLKKIGRENGADSDAEDQYEPMRHYS